MPRRLLVPIHPAGLPARRVRLMLVAPHFTDTILPTLTGRLVRPLPGYFGLLRYLAELDEALPAGFDPLGELPWFARARSIRYLVLTPAPDAPTLQASPDVLGETVARGGMLHVFVSAGPTSRALRADPVTATAEARCPFLCMADLESLGRGSRIASPTA
jgi:hypothetical protein